MITAIILGWTVDPAGSRTRSTGSASATPNSIKFLGVVYGAAALVYVVARLYRRSQGVDLDAIHSEIPAE